MFDKSAAESLPHAELASSGPVALHRAGNLRRVGARRALWRGVVAAVRAVRLPLVVSLRHVAGARNRPFASAHPRQAQISPRSRARSDGAGVADGCAGRAVAALALILARGATSCLSGAGRCAGPARAAPPGG
jgi:hypothetical protein